MVLFSFLLLFGLHFYLPQIPTHVFFTSNLLPNVDAFERPGRSTSAETRFNSNQDGKKNSNQEGEKKLLAYSS